MAILSSLALVYVHGVDGNVWKEVWGAKRPGDVVWGGALGTCVGAWLGAVPVPLDWYALPFSLRGGLGVFGDVCANVVLCCAGIGRGRRIRLRC